jgi:phthiodiolone/phenolphthiodiolone dimycocerosates ketoreductase
MLDIAGRLADGWLPTRMSVEEYGEKLNTIKRVGAAHGRDMSQFTPSMYTYLVIDEDHEVCHKLLDTPIIKSYCMIPPPEIFAKCGAEHPLGKTYGLLDYIPSHFSREAALEAIGKIPRKVSEYFIMHGTPDDVVKELKEFAKVGLQHVVLENITFLGDLSKVRSSYACMSEVVKQVTVA